MPYLLKARVKFCIVRVPNYPHFCFRRCQRLCPSFSSTIGHHWEYLGWTSGAREWAELCLGLRPPSLHGSGRNQPLHPASWVWCVILQPRRDVPWRPSGHHWLHSSVGGALLCVNPTRRGLLLGRCATSQHWSCPGPLSWLPGLHHVRSMPPTQL